MGLLLHLSSSSSTSYHRPVLSTKALPAAASPILRLRLKSINFHSISPNGLYFFTPITAIRRVAMTIKAPLDIKGTGPDGGESSSESDDDEDVLLDKLPLDSKLQQKLEHKMRVKLAKCIRLRRKKLVRTRRTRKKGSAPPSKVNKLQNLYLLRVDTESLHS